MYKQREIVIIPIPYTDLSSQKKRPVVVISNDHYNGAMEDIVVVAMTSNVEKKDYSILVSNKDMEEGILLYESMIRVDKIYTLKQSIVSKKFGFLKKELFNQIKTLINTKVAFKIITRRQGGGDESILNSMLKEPTTKPTLVTFEGDFV